MNIFGHIAKLAVKYKWLVVVFWIGATVATNVYLPSIASVTQANNSGFLPGSSPFTKAEDMLRAFNGGKSPRASLAIVAANTGHTLSPADMAAVSAAMDKVRGVSGITAVHQAGVSKDGKAIEYVAATNLSSNGSGMEPAAQKLVDAVRSAISSVSRPGGLAIHVTGSLAQAVDSNSQAKYQRSDTTIYSVVFIFILLLIVFRSVLAPLVTLVPAAVSLAIAGPVIAAATKTGMQISSITQLLLIVLILGAGTDYGLFLIFRTREELRRGLTPSEAIVKSLAQVGQIITFSAATVICALLSLLLATFGLYRGLGPGLAIGLTIMLAAALTLLPALLAILGRSAFWPTKTHARPAEAGLWGRLADSVLRRPVLVLIVGVVILGGLAAGVIGFSVGGFSDTTSVSANSDSALGQKVIADHFPASVANPQVLVVQYPRSVWDDMTQLATTQKNLKTSSAFTSVVGPLNPAGITLAPAQLLQLHSLAAHPSRLVRISPQEEELYHAATQAISPDGKTVEFEALLSAGPTGSTAALNAIPTARQALKQVATGAVATGIVSDDAAGYDIDNAATTDLEHIVPFVLLVIGVLLAILLRSLVAPLYLVATVALSYLAALGFAMIVFVHIKHDDGLIFILPLLMFIFSMALGEDYNILVMSRIREEAHETSTLAAAVHKAMAVTGTTVTSAGLILAGTFGVLAVVAGGSGSNDMVQQIALSIAFGILLDTFLVRTLLVPSIVVLLRHWNWWPSALAMKHRDS